MVFTYMILFLKINNVSVVMENYKFTLEDTKCNNEINLTEVDKLLKVSTIFSNRLYQFVAWFIIFLSGNIYQKSTYTYIKVCILNSEAFRNSYEYVILMAG